MQNIHGKSSSQEAKEAEEEEEDDDDEDCFHQLLGIIHCHSVAFSSINLTWTGL
jgi:hypothetical protein